MICNYPWWGFPTLDEAIKCAENCLLNGYANAHIDELSDKKANRMIWGPKEQNRE